jgi:hypothetical protein
MQPTENPPPPEEVSRQCDLLTAGYDICNKAGDKPLALMFYIRLHELQDGY